MADTPKTLAEFPAGSIVFSIQNIDQEIRETYYKIVEQGRRFAICGYRQGVPPDVRAKHFNLEGTGYYAMGTLSSLGVKPFTETRFHEVETEKPDQVDPKKAMFAFARVWVHAVEVWGSEADAREFLSQPHALLRNRSPIDLILERRNGEKLVTAILSNMKPLTPD